MAISTLHVAYICSSVYPGDFASYYTSNTCAECEEHAVGSIKEQWELLKQFKTGKHCAYWEEYIVEHGTVKPIELKQSAHEVLVNGHHRIFAALNSGLEVVPVLIG